MAIVNFRPYTLEELFFFKSDLSYTTAHRLAKLDSLNKCKKIKLTIYKDITVFSYDYVVHERINAHTFEPRKFSNESKFDLNDRISDALFRKQLFFYKFKFNHTLKNIL